MRVRVSTLEKVGYTDESWNPTRPDMTMDEEGTINEAFNFWVVTIGWSKESNSSEASVSQH